MKLMKHFKPAFKRIVGWVFVGALLSSCGSQGINQSRVTGAGVIKKISSFEYYGIALEENSTGKIYLLPNRDDLEYQVGSMVEFEGSLDETPVPVGVPQKVNFTKFNIVGFSCE